MRENNIYSLIEKNRPKKNVSFDNKKMLDYFYDKTFSYISLSMILTTIFQFIMNENIKLPLNTIKNGSADASILLLFIVTLFMGIRLFQSIYLAKKDYTSITCYFIDTIIFAAVCLFISFPFLFFKYIYIHIKYVYIIYTIISLIATINFIHLFSVRLKRHRKELDYFIERRIQLFNCIISLLITGIFFIISIMLFNENNNNTSVIIALGTTICISLILNMVHSWRLTAMPKIELHNEADCPHNINLYLTNVLGGVLNQKNQTKISNILKKETNTFKYLEISRVGEKSDIDKITDSLTIEFSYIFEYIFDTNDPSKLKRVVHSTLTSAFGFGSLGYKNFYLITKNINNSKKEIIGWMKINSLYECWIYKFLEFLWLFITIIFQFGISKSIGICRRAKEIKDSQPSIKRNEFELTYFVIYDQFRNNKYGTYALNLLLNALFHSNTNNINCSKLTLLVREFNNISRTLFNKVGFIVYTPEESVEEPIKIIGTKGKGIFMQYSLTQSI